MSATLSELTGAPIIAVGEIAPATVAALQRRIARALDDGHTRIVVDLGNVTVLGTQTTCQFCAALRRVDRRGAMLAIADAHPRLERVLELCELDGVELYPSVGAALSAAGAEQPEAGGRG